MLQKEPNSIICWNSALDNIQFKKVNYELIEGENRSIFPGTDDDQADDLSDNFMI